MTIKVKITHADPHPQDIIIHQLNDKDEVMDKEFYSCRVKAGETAELWINGGLKLLVEEVPSGQ